MHRFFLALILFSASSLAVSQETNTTLTEHTYWIRPGKERQFLAHYKKTFFKQLQAEKAAGHVLWVRMTEPTLSGRNSEWDFRLTIAWSSAAAMQEFQRKTAAQLPSIEEAMGRELIEEQSEVVVSETDVISRN